MTCRLILRTSFQKYINNNYRNGTIAVCSYHMHISYFNQVDSAKKKNFLPVSYLNQNAHLSFILSQETTFFNAFFDADIKMRYPVNTLCIVVHAKAMETAYHNFRIATFLIIKRNIMTMLHLV